LRFGVASLVGEWTVTGVNTGTAVSAPSPARRRRTKRGRLALEVDRLQHVLDDVRGGAGDITIEPAAQAEACLSQEIMEQETAP
jgi:hypothetical protein